MSNTKAIATVTSALYNRAVQALNVDSNVAGADITILPLDKALDQPGSTSSSPHQLNIFLYHVAHTTAFRNRGAPGSGGGATPLALTLHYLVSANSNDGDDLASHRILGAVMSAFHDEPVLSPKELGDAATTVAGADVHLQLDKVRITEQALSTEEMYKLWSAFQTHYRVSAAYEVSVVVIDSRKPIKAPLPALSVVTPEDPLIPHQRSPMVTPRIDLSPAYPIITAVSPPSPRDYALRGDTLTIAGHHLTDDPGATLTAYLSHPILATPAEIVASVSQGTVTIVIPDAGQSSLPSGVYSLSLEIQPTTGKTIVTNAVPVLLAPVIESAPSSVALGGGQAASLTISVKPDVLPHQRVHLLVGGRGFALSPTPSSPAQSLSFSCPVAPGDYRLRVRVDGADSPMFDPDAAAPVSPFHLAPTVTITP